MKILGIDPSLRGLALVYVGENFDVEDYVYFTGVKTLLTNPRTKKKFKQGVYLDKNELQTVPDFILFYFNYIDKYFSKNKPDLIMLEGVSFGSRNINNWMDIYSIIRLLCAKYKIKFIEVPPRSLKKFALKTGSGGKDLMVKAAYKDLKWEFDQHGDCSRDIIDAAYLSLLGRCWYNHINKLPNIRLVDQQRQIIKDLNKKHKGIFDQQGIEIL